jgi:hypothetical protein
MLRPTSVPLEADQRRSAPLGRNAVLEQRADPLVDDLRDGKVRE